MKPKLSAIYVGGGVTTAPERLTTRLTADAYRRLRLECARRSRTGAAYIPYGTVISEALAHYLPDAKKKVRRKPAKPAARPIAQTA